MNNKIIDCPEYIKLLNETNSLPLPWEKLKNSNILITGAYGLIGSYLVDVFLNSNLNIQVYALGRNKEKLMQRFNYYQNNANLHLVVQDIIKPLDLNVKFDYIIHAASGASPKLYASNPVDIMLANFMGMYNILEFVRKSGCQRVYYVSSSEVYGNAAINQVFEEAKPIITLNNIRNCYPDSKRAAETLCQSYTKGVASDGKMYYTKDDDKAIAQFFNKALNKENIILKSKGLQKRSYCHVADCVNAILYQLLLGKNGEAYNIANNNSYITIADLAQTISDIADVKVEFDLPADLKNDEGNQNIEISMSTAKAESLGWKPNYNIKEGVTNTLKIKKYIK